MTLRHPLILFASVFAVACGGGAAVQQVNARPMADVPKVAFGDCVEARKRASVEPDLAVDRLPSPVRQSPAPLRNVPQNVKSHIARNGAVVRVHVLVDTLGRADMKTFAVDTTSHPWLVSNVKSVIPRWRFTPAELAGCKVPRVYKFAATSPKAG